VLNELPHGSAFGPVEVVTGACYEFNVVIYVVTFSLIRNSNENEELVDFIESDEGITENFSVLVAD
jgi:hypothetical protein